MIFAIPTKAGIQKLFERRTGSPIKLGMAECIRYNVCMSINLRSTYRLSDEYARIAIFALFGTVISSIVASVFLSSTLVFALLIGVIVVIVTFFKPTWSLAFLLFFLPFEPFLLKWIPDDVYVFARFFSEMLVYILVLATLWKILTGAVKWKSSLIDVPFLLFLVAIFATTVVNVVNPLDAMLGSRQILRFILLFFVTLYLAPTRKWMKTVFIGLLAILAFQAFLGYSQFLFGETIDSFLLPSESRTVGEVQLTSGTVQFWDPGQRVFGTLGRYDRLGVFMAFVMLIMVSCLYEPKLKKYHKTLMVLLIASLPVLALTYSRSAWFGFLLGFLFIALWAKRDRRIAVVSGILVVFMFIYLGVTGLVVNRLIDVPDQNITERFFEAFSYERWRGEYYGLGRLFWIVQTITEVVPASPIFGHGPSMYGGGAVAALSNTDVYDSLNLPFGVYGTEGYIDNNWLSLWGETGTLGFAMYLWLYISLFFLCVRVYRRSDSAQTRALALGIAAAMIAATLNAFLATFFEVRTFAPYIWVSAALVVVQGSRERIL
jgi:hypothetical protein